MNQNKFEQIVRQFAPASPHETVPEALDWLQKQPLKSMLVIAQRDDETRSAHVIIVNGTPEFMEGAVLHAIGAQIMPRIEATLGPDPSFQPQPMTRNERRQARRRAR